MFDKGNDQEGGQGYHLTGMSQANLPLTVSLLRHQSHTVATEMCA
jgi:hypothetical protein